MSRFRRFEIIEPNPSPSLFLRETSIFTPRTMAALNPFSPSSFLAEDELDYALDFLAPKPPRFGTLIDVPVPPPFDEFDAVADLIQIDRTPFYTSTRRVQHWVAPATLCSSDYCLQSLCDRVSALELGFDRWVKPDVDQKYTWTAEIESPEKDGVDRKYKWVAERNEKKNGGFDKSYKWTAEIKGKGANSPISSSYTRKASTTDAYAAAAGYSSGSDKEKCNKEKESKKKGVSLVEIQEPSDRGATVLRQAFVKRTGVVAKSKGKRKELSPLDAALMIQMSFRAHLIRRSQALRALRELAIAKSKLKELRAMFNNFSYRRRVARDPEERQRFSEKIIVLLLTIDAIEGADLTVRTAKRSMVDELEAMLDVVDPHPGERSLSTKRRTFDMPNRGIQKELAAGVAQVVQMLDQESNGLAC